MPAPTPPPPAKPSSHAFQAPTGTRDLYPADLARLRFVQDAWRRASITHGFDEIDGPTFEHLDLYTVKSGEGIVSELFSFERFGGEKAYALRPEFTPTLARMYAARANALSKPTKWFWLQNCFRAERPQRGRLREFFQWNCDIIGDDSAAADADIIEVAIAAMRDLGLGPADIRVRINDRRSYQAWARSLGVPDEKLPGLYLIEDQRPKLEPAELKKLIDALDLPAHLAVALVNAGGTTYHLDPDLLQARREPGASQHAFSAEHFVPLSRELQTRGLAEWCIIDTSIVRGLAYYTGMVFEVHEASGAERAVAGGGRYDGLIELFGGPPTPAVGFGMGDVVLSLVMKDREKMPTDDDIAAHLGLRPDAFVISNGTPEADAALTRTLSTLRRAGLHARRSAKATRNVGKLLQDAAKSRARFAVILEGGTHATVKNLDTQQQDPAPIALEQLPARLCTDAVRNEPRTK